MITMFFQGLSMKYLTIQRKSVHVLFQIAEATEWSNYSKLINPEEDQFHLRQIGVILDTCICLLGNNIEEIEAYFEKEGKEFLLRPQLIDAPNLKGLSFLYIWDPDGIPIEVMVLPGK